MPTKKTRVGFIPRSNVLALINKLSNENNLSYSKIVNILVEEALHERGLLNSLTGNVPDENVYEKRTYLNHQKTDIVNKEFKYNFTNKLLNEKNPYFKEVNDKQFDNEIYEKFLMFLQFQERMKKRD